MPAKISTYGVKLYRDSIALNNEIKGLLSVNGVNVDRPHVDSTTHDDTYRTKVPGIFEAQPVVIQLALDPQDVEHTRFLTQIGTDTPSTAARDWVLTYPSNEAGDKKASWTFKAHNGSWNEGEKTVEGLLQVEMTLIITGKPTYNADNQVTPA